MRGPAATSYQSKSVVTEPRITRPTWAWIGVVAALFLWFHWSYVNRMIHIATNMPGGKNPLEMLVHIVKHRWNPDWSHILVIPFISLYFIIRDRQKLVDAPRQVFSPGLVLLFFGMLSFAWWIYPGRNDMFQGFSMILALFGLALFLLGPATMRVLWFPIAYLIFFVKVSDRIWDQVAWKLQGVAAAAATVVLNIFSLFIDFDVSKTGNQLQLGFYEGSIYVTRGLEVAQACSGLRMLMAFVALGVAMAYLADRSTWQRVIMVLMAVPIAVAVNVGRVVMLAMLMMVNQEMTKGDFHTFLGMLMLIPAAGMFWLVGWILDKLVVYDDAALAAPSGQAPSEDVAPPRASWTLRDAVVGLAAGGLLAAVVGLNYYLLLIALQPFRARISQSLATAIMAGGLVILVLAAFWVRWLIKRRQPRPPDESGAPPQWMGGHTVACSIAVGILVASLGGFEVVKRVNEIVLLKEPVHLRQPLYRLRQDFGPWQWEGEPSALEAEGIEALGTRQYISYHFRDTSVARHHRGGRVHLHVAYYTGKPDTVPHVPDRCIVAGGGVGVDKRTVAIKLDGPQFDRSTKGVTSVGKLARESVAIPALEFNSTLFRYHVPTHPNRTLGAAYFFVANNKFLHTPDLVRLKGFDPRDRYSYYCKIELALGEIGSADEAAERASKFLSTFMPEIMACLPDWQQLNERSINHDQGT